MKGLKKVLKSSIKQERGVALLMVLSTITLLTYVLAEFTFETKLNKIKTQNLMDKLQSRLTAEAGVKFALAKLRIYGEAINLLEKNKTLKEAIKPESLEGMIKQPFMFPIPLSKDSNIIQKSAVQEFAKNTILMGTLSVNIKSVSGFINPNNLRIKEKSKNPTKPKVKKEEDRDEDEDSKDNAKTVSELTFKQIVEALTKSIEDKKSSDEEFDALYGNVDPEYLAKELKFYVMDEKEMDEATKAEVDGKFAESNIIPKHAPMTSLEELYLLPSWSDTIVELIKDRLSIHEVSIIHINEITKDQLYVIFPKITEEQTEEFFKYRDGDPENNQKPHKFKDEKDFKSYIVGNLQVLDNSNYDKRLKELKAAGLSLGTAGKLFQVISKGTYGRATYKITAYIDLPIKPVPVEVKKKKDKEDENKVNPEDEDPDNVSDEKDADPDKEDEKKKKKEPPRELMRPRVVEIKFG